MTTTTSAPTTYQTPGDIRKGDRVRHPEGETGTVLVDPGWAVQILMDGQPEPELWQAPFVVVNFTLLGRAQS